MPIICFEGASAVGKTATSKALKDKCGAFVVPEVNQLFERPENEPDEWYFERQVDRWQLALENSQTDELVVLDGDPFQPLWYNWAYNFVGWQKLDFMERFYGAMMQNKMIEFPHLYFIFSTSEAELRKRRAGDATRQRRHFEIHLKMIAPMRRYFEAMHAAAPGQVLFLEAESIESNIEFIRQHVAGLQTSKGIDSEFLLSKMIKWLRENKA
jgi:thymidylate kinase